MNTKATLESRADCKCELCEATDALDIYQVPPGSDNGPDNCLLLCETCRDQIENPDETDPNHWRCLNNSMWSQTPVVQVMAWRMLHRLSNESWAQDLLAMLYLEDDVLAWAKATGDESHDQKTEKHLDSNGAILAAGDTITLIKDLNVKGAGFTAKRGTAVRNISLVSDNPKHIEGRVNGQQIVILTEFVKKSG